MPDDASFSTPRLLPHHRLATDADATCPARRYCTKSPLSGALNTSSSAAPRTRVGIGGSVPRVPVLAFVHDRLAGVAAVAVLDIASIVRIAHQ